MFYVFLVGLAKLHCGATPPSVMVLFKRNVVVCLTSWFPNKKSSASKGVLQVVFNSNSKTTLTLITTSYRGGLCFEIWKIMLNLFSFPIIGYHQAPTSTRGYSTT